MFSDVAAGVSPAVEPGILPQRNKLLKSCGYLQLAEKPGVLSRRQDAALYGSQAGRRYAAVFSVQSQLSALDSMPETPAFEEFPGIQRSSRNIPAAAASLQSF